jgi:hypothetical protein
VTSLEIAVRGLGTSILIIALFLLNISYGNETATDFDRDTAMERYKELCQRELSLAMGTASNRQGGMSRKEQVREIETNDAASDETKKILLDIVEELYSVPDIDGGTYVLYRFESCLVGNWFREHRLPVEDVAEELLACQRKASSDELDKLVACIDEELLRSRAVT